MISHIQYHYFSIGSTTDIHGEDLKNLRTFYTPILGSDAILLYEYLRDLYVNNTQEAGYYDYENLCTLLSMSQKQLNDARIKLESVSLLSTFIDEYNRKTMFMLDKPLNKQGFRSNLLLANKLTKIIGRQNFDKLLGLERNIYLTKTKYLVDVSAKYDDVFNIQDDLLINNLQKNDKAELDSSQLTTSEINVALQEKLELNSFQYPNPYEAILKTDSRFFYSQLTGQFPSLNIINLIKNCRDNTFNDPCINLIFYYAYESNNKIVYAYVDKIVKDFIKKGIDNFENIEKYLDQMLKAKNGSLISKKDLYKATYYQNLARIENDIHRGNNEY